MAQARTLRKSELKQLIDVTTGCSRYPQRDVTMLLFSHLCGLRVGEIASLRFDDVLDDKSNVLDEITLDASRTKDKRARNIFLPCQMQNHVEEYVASMRERPLHGFLLSTCSPQQGSQGATMRLLFCSSLLLLGARLKREYQWASQAVFPQGKPF